MELTAIQAWFWFGFIGLAAGSLIILYLTGKVAPRKKVHGLIALLITVIATISYYALARGQADITVAGHVVYLGRYIDWVFTTPLLLLSLLIIALPSAKNGDASKQRASLVATVLIADVLMIITGLFADLSTSSTDKSVWYISSCVFFLVVLWKMYGEVRKLAKSKGKKSLAVYTGLLGYLSFVWLLYPLVWLLGHSGYSFISATSETALYAIMDISAKAVFGILLVVYASKIESKK
jgi:bacteriorhodopsin